MKNMILAVLLIGLLGQDATACSRCRRSPCVYASTYTYTPALTQVTPNVFVTQNNYPQPLVGTGTTLYQGVQTPSYQQSVLPLMNPDVLITQEFQLMKAGDQASALRHERLMQFADKVLAGQQAAVEALAKGQAAAMVLNASGVATTTQQAMQTSTSVLISRNADGSVKVEPVTKEQVQEAQKTTDNSSKLSQFCGNCHGRDIAAPKGGLYLVDDDASAKAMREKFFSIVEHVSNKTMPPANAPQPSDAERKLILDEIQTMIKNRSGT